MIIFFFFSIVFNLGLLVVLNTFAAPVLFAISLPLLLFWTQIPNRLLGTGNKTSRQSSKGEFDWIEAPDLLRTRLFRLIVMYHALHSIKVGYHFFAHSRTFLRS